MDLGARHLPAVLGVQRLLRAALSRAARERRRDAAGARAGARRAGDLSSRAHPAADDDRRDDRVRALLPRLCERLGEPRRADRAGLIGQFPIRPCPLWGGERSEEHTSELQSLMRISYAVFCLKKKKQRTRLQCILYSPYTTWL